MLLKLPGDYTDFNLDLKINLSHLLDAKKIIFTKKKKKKKKKTSLKLFTIWSHLLRPTFSSNAKCRGTREQKF